MTEELTPEEARLLAELLRRSGREPGSFTAVIQPDGLVRVSGPRGTAFYPRGNWLSRFSRHLHKSFFDPAVPAPSGPRLDRHGSPTLAAPA